MNIDDVRQQAVADYFRDEIRRTLDMIEDFDLVDLGLPDLDLDDFKERLEPLIASREIKIEKLEHVSSLLESMLGQMLDWSQFRDNLYSDVNDIIAAATPEPDEEEVAA